MLPLSPFGVLSLRWRGRWHPLHILDASLDTLLLEQRLTLRLVLSGELRFLGGHQLDVSLLGTLSLCLLAERQEGVPHLSRAERALLEMLGELERARPSKIRSARSTCSCPSFAVDCLGWCSPRSRRTGHCASLRTPLRMP